MSLRDRIDHIPGVAVLMIAVVVVVLASYAALSAPGLPVLSGAQEVPAVTTTATATSTIAIGADMSVTGAVETSGIDGTMAHIHQGAVGLNGPIVVTLERTAANRWSVPMDTMLTDDQYQAYLAGRL
jgi:CHRD domain